MIFHQNVKLERQQYNLDWLPLQPVEYTANMGTTLYLICIALISSSTIVFQENTVDCLVLMEEWDLLCSTGKWEPLVLHSLKDTHGVYF